MSKYTAEDFANAAFAELPKYGIRAHKSAGNSFWKCDGITRTTDEEMADAGWVPAPDQVPGRTITESELREYVEEIWDYVDHEGVKELAGWCGANVIPDPKPTNAESIGYLIDAYRSISFPTMALSDYLDKAGVKAPTDD